MTPVRFAINARLGFVVYDLIYMTITDLLPQHVGAIKAIEKHNPSKLAKGSEMVLFLFSLV